MLLSDQKVITKWTKQNKNHYEKLGYIFTKINDKFEVCVEDLSPSSHILVKIQCDNCGVIKERQWRDYLKYHSKQFGDLCSDCKIIKQKATCLELYGFENPSQVKDFQEKRTETILKHFGVVNAFQSEKCKEKSRETCLNKYGVEYPSQSEEIICKIQETNLQKYGYKFATQSEKVKNKTKETNLRKYGAEYPMQNPNILKKTRESLYLNGTIPTSKQEKEICKLLKEIYGEENCCPGFPLDKLNFDCLLSVGGIKIDIEYDGDFWHKNAQQKDMKRDYFVKSKGFKILRIKGNYEIPSKEQLIKAIDYLITTENNHAEIILDTEMKK